MDHNNTIDYQRFNNINEETVLECTHTGTSINTETKNIQQMQDMLKLMTKSMKTSMKRSMSLKQNKAS